MPGNVFIQFLHCKQVLRAKKQPGMSVGSWATVAQHSQTFKSNDSGVPFVQIIKSAGKLEI